MASASGGRPTRSRRSSVSPIPLTAAGRSPRAKNKHETETEESDGVEANGSGGGEKRAGSPPFYPTNHHVRFSPSVKNTSPYGRKTRSSRRRVGSYLQTLASEDEQSEFNRQVRPPTYPTILKIVGLALS